MLRRMLACVLAAGTLAVLAGAQPAAAASPFTRLCSVAGVLNGLAGKACTLAGDGSRFLGAAKKLAGGDVSGAVGTVLGGSARGAAGTGAAIALAAVVASSVTGSRFALDETAKVIGATSSPRLAAPWFSVVYWRVAGIAVLLTLPFLFLAAVQGLLRSEPALLVRCAFGYLPLAMLGVGVAAQLTGMLLTVTDQLCAVVSSAAGGVGPSFLHRAAVAIGGLAVAFKAPFLAFFVAALTVAGAVVLWIEMLVREAAVYVIVVLLPLAFSAMVWPARRIWALRAIELLVALILSKLAIITVLTLGGAALDSSGPLTFMAGIVLLSLAIFAPWAMLRLVPFAELAGAAQRLRPETIAGARTPATVALGVAETGRDWAASTTARMRRDAERGAAAPDELPAPADADPGRAEAGDAGDVTEMPSEPGDADLAGPETGDPDAVDGPLVPAAEGEEPPSDIELWFRGGADLSHVLRLGPEMDYMRDVPRPPAEDAAGMPEPPTSPDGPPPPDGPPFPDTPLSPDGPPASADPEDRP